MPDTSVHGDTSSSKFPNVLKGGVCWNTLKVQRLTDSQSSQSAGAAVTLQPALNPLEALSGGSFGFPALR